MNFARRGGLALLIGIIATVALRVTLGLSDAAAWANLVVLPSLFVGAWEVLAQYGGDTSASEMSAGKAPHETNHDQVTALRDQIRRRLMQAYAESQAERLRGRAAIEQRWMVAERVFQGVQIVDPSLDEMGARGTSGLAEALRTSRDRMVILGNEGSGKSFSITQMAIDHLTLSGKGPIPYICSPLNWDPLRQALSEFLQDDILNQYPDLESVATRPVLQEFISEHMLLPMIDGLHVMSSQLQSKALARMNVWLGAGNGLVFTSSAKNYETLLTEARGEALAESTAIRLADVRPLDALRYLRFQAARGDAGEQWPDGVVVKASRELHGALKYLNTPLLVSMGWESSKAGTLTPSHLIALSREGKTELENSLIVRYVDAALKSVADQVHTSYLQVDRWTFWLVDHLHRRKVERFGWWGVASFSTSPGLAIGLGVFAFSVNFGLENICTIGIASVPSLLLAFITSSVIGLVVAGGALNGYRTHPAHVSIRFPTRQELVTGLVGGPMVGTFTQILLLVALAATNTRIEWPFVLVGPVIGLGVGFVAALGSSFDTALEEVQMLSAESVYNSARRGALVYAISVSLCSSIVFGVSFYLFAPSFPFQLLVGSKLELGLRGAALGGLAMLIPTISLTRWGQFVFVHTCRAIRGQMPIRYWKFLSALVESGLLRTVGARHELGHGFYERVILALPRETGSWRPRFRR